MICIGVDVLRAILHAWAIICSVSSPGATSSGYQVPEPHCDCLNRCKEHYSELLNKDPVPHNSETSTAAANATTDLSISEDEVTLDEVRNAVKSLKNDRAAGICNVTAELLKFGGECMLRWLQVIINCVWISETIPDDWRRGIILPFWSAKATA